MCSSPLSSDLAIYLVVHLHFFCPHFCFMRGCKIIKFYLPQARRIQCFLQILHTSYSNFRRIGSFNDDSTLHSPIRERSVDNCLNSAKEMRGWVRSSYPLLLLLLSNVGQPNLLSAIHTIHHKLVCHMYIHYDPSIFPHF